MKYLMTIKFSDGEDRKTFCTSSKHRMPHSLIGIDTAVVEINPKGLPQALQDLDEVFGVKEVTIKTRMFKS